jgi:hypothetical protein
MMERVEAPQVMEALEAALARSAFEVTHDVLGGEAALVARRADWKTALVHMHFFVVVFDSPGLEVDRAENLTAEAQQYAIKHKGGLPRGLQTGSATVAVFLSQPSEGLQTWFAAEPRHRFAALRFPVLADPDSGSLTYFKGRMARGSAYQADLRKIADDIVKPALNPR